VRAYAKDEEKEGVTAYSLPQPQLVEERKKRK